MPDDELISRAGRNAWFGLLGLVLPLAILTVLISGVLADADRDDWVRVVGTVGAEVDLDHRMVTFALPGGAPETRSVPVMRTVVEGDLIELYFPPGRPDLIEQDRGSLAFVYVLFGGGAVLMGSLIVGSCVTDSRRARRYRRLLSEGIPEPGVAHSWSYREALNRVQVIDVFLGSDARDSPQRVPAMSPDLRVGVDPFIDGLAGLEGVFACQVVHIVGGREVVVTAGDGTLAGCGTTPGRWSGRRLAKARPSATAAAVLTPTPPDVRQLRRGEPTAEMSRPAAVRLLQGLFKCCIGLALAGFVVARGLGSGEWMLPLAAFTTLWVIGSVAEVRREIGQDIRWTTVRDEPAVAQSLDRRMAAALGWPSWLRLLIPAALLVSFVVPLAAGY